MKKSMRFVCMGAVCAVGISACMVGPDYVRPKVILPTKFKEAPRGWKIAQPQDDKDHGCWWLVFHDPILNDLEKQLTQANQNIAVALAQFSQARAVVAEARAGFFPTIAATLSITRQQQQQSRSNVTGFTSTSTPSGSTVGATSSGSTTFGSSTPSTSESFMPTASWEPDIWGAVRRTVEADVAGAQASAAQVAAVRLSEQASLAQYYFQLRGLDEDQRLLDDTVAEYRKALKLTQNRYTSGVVPRADIVQAESQLQSAEAQAINNKLNRAKYEHAIAILIGQPPAAFCLPSRIKRMRVPRIPLQIPCALLERRPDIAQAERQMAQANAQIGVAVAAYFPSLTISGSGTMQGHDSIGNWLSHPALGWQLGTQLVETLFDGGLRDATTDAARAAYRANLGTYHQTLLTAFQDVEDNLASIRILHAEGIVLRQAAMSAKWALVLVTNQYKAGTVDYTSVITAQNTAFAAEKNAVDNMYLQMTSAVGLIKALGGGWNAAVLPHIIR